MNRPLREKTRPRSVRLPDRLWKLLEEAAVEDDIYVNEMLWRLSEGFLIKRGFLDKHQRKRLPIK